MHALCRLIALGNMENPGPLSGEQDDGDGGTSEGAP